MYKRTKYILITIAVVSQIGVIIALFNDITLAIKLVVVNMLSFAILILIFILERLKEKKEEINYDDLDY